MNSLLRSLFPGIGITAVMKRVYKPSTPHDFPKLKQPQRLLFALLEIPTFTPSVHIQPQLNKYHSVLSFQARKMVGEVSYSYENVTRLRLAAMGLKTSSLGFVSSDDWLGILT